MSKVIVNQPNELIEWKTNDEIGKLVAEYNKMILKIEESTKLLSISERESAWREMAKQVAHEIKNPLTPIKLNIQLLQKTLDDKHPEFENRFRKSSKVILEQIDALARIASEFSNFAKMPKAQNEVFNPVENINNCISLFEEENRKITWNIIDNTSENTKIFADKNQITRVFNNLLKNAIQAIPEEKDGIIEIRTLEENDEFVMKITDNGVGIDEEMKIKIFTPNFTTKSGGMGLGLAMVKNIIDQCNGKIGFDSKSGIGTTFWLKIPITKNK
jgi:nitrogen fixation/metabolism regulation signal transduction histidine kinase